MRFASNFSEILAAFNKHNVNYMVVGGYAVNFHGYERNTSDLDIWVKPTADNLVIVVSSLRDLGFDEESLNHINGFNPTEPYLFHIGLKPDDIEVFNFVTGVKYEDAEPHKVVFNDADNLTVYFISIRDLLINKMLAGRTQDKLDVEMLQKIQNLK
jgi:hypothetical protein